MKQMDPCRNPGAMLGLSRRRSPVFLVLLLTVLCAPLALRADVVFRRPNIEAAQRALQERYIHWSATARANGLDLSGFPEKIIWPALANGKQPGDFPEDCFYNEELIDPATQEINYTFLCFLIADLANKVDTYVPGSRFIRPDYVDQIHLKDVVQSTSPTGNRRFGSTGFVVVNPPVYPASTVTPWNYHAFFQIAADHILFRSHPFFNAYSTDNSGALDRGGVTASGWGWGYTCSEARNDALADFEVLSAGPEPGMMLGRRDETIWHVDALGTNTFATHTQTWRGRHGFDHSALGSLGGRAQIVLLVLDDLAYFYGTPSTIPASAGGAPGDRYCTYVIDRVGLTSGGKYFTPEYGTSHSFVAPCPSGTGDANASRFGYSVAAYAVASPDFKEQIGSYFVECEVCSSCSGDCPPGGPTTFTLGSLDYRVPLGFGREGSAGTASLYSDTADFLLASPFGLNLGTSREATVLRDTSYSSIPRQIVLPQGLVDIQVLSPFKSYVMKFYDTANRGSLVNGFYQPAADSAYKTITVTNPGLNSTIINGAIDLSTSNYQIAAPNHGLVAGNYYVRRIDAESGPLPMGYTIGQLERNKLYYVYALNSSTLALLYFDSAGQAWLDGFEQAVVGQTLRISSPFPFNDLEITEVAGSLTRSFDYSYTSSSTQDTAMVSETNGSRVRTSYVITNKSVPGTLVEDTGEEDGAGNVITQTRREYRVFPWNDANAFDRTERRELVKEIRDPAGAALATTYSYYENSSTDGVNYSRLKQVVRHDGTWERYEYDSRGRAIRTYSGFADALPTSDPSLCRVVETSSFGGASVGDLDADGRAEMLEHRIERVQGKEVARTYRLTWSSIDAQGRQRVSDIRCLEPGAAWNAASNVTSDSWTFTRGEFSGDPAKSKSEDGILTVYSYGTDTATGRKTTTVAIGVPSADGESVTDGTRVVTIANAAGMTIDRTTTDVASNIVVARAYTPDAYVDAAGRALRVYTLDGRFTETIYEDCCGTVTTIDKAGNISSEHKDASGYLLKRVRNGIAEIYSEGYDNDASDGVAGFTRLQHRVPRGATAGTLVSVETYDPAGRLIAQLDPRDGVNRLTQHAEGTDASGRWRRSVTTPDGTVSTMSYYRDGTVCETHQAGTLRTRQTPGVEGDTHDGRTFFAQTLVVTNIGEGDSETEWTKTYQDTLGRAYKTEFPDASGAAAGILERRYFDARGRVVRQVDPDGVPTLFRYNDRGELTHTAIDIDRDGAITFAGADRIQRRTQQVVSDPVRGNVLRTTTGEWRKTGADEETVVTTVDASTDGLQTWSTTNGLTTHTSTSYLGGGEMEISSTSPDGTIRTVRSKGGFVTLQQVSHPIAGTLGHATFVPDALDRTASTKNELTGAITSFTYYDNDRVRTQTRTAGDVTQATEYLYDAMDRVVTVVLPDATRTETRYHAEGQIRAQYGAATTPTEYVYDRQNRLAKLTTWQQFNDALGVGIAGAAETTFEYDARGQLRQKRDHAGQGNSYTYTPGGRLRTRDSARLGADGVLPIRTTYVYGSDGAADTSVASGDLQAIYHSNDPASTRAMVADLDRLGRTVRVSDAAGTRDLRYEDDRLAAETYVADAEPATPDPLAGFALERRVDALQRYAGFALKNAAAETAHDVGYDYDPASRLGSVTFSGHSVSHSYDPAAVTRITQTFNGPAGSFLTVAQNFDALDRLVSRINSASARQTSVSYAFDQQNRRTKSEREDGSYWSFGYDDRGQLTSGVKKTAAGAVAPGLEFGYTFDDIGNRLTATRSSQVSAYRANLLNQYTEIVEPRVVEVTGSADPAATVTVNGRPPARREGELFFDEVDFSTDPAAGWKDIVVTGVLAGGGVGGTNRVAAERRQAYLPASPTLLTYDADGNVLADDKWTYAWDAENRLVTMETHPSQVAPLGQLAPAQRVRLEFTYDAQSRRVGKKVYAWNADTSAWTLQSARHFLYDGWNLIAEYAVTPGTANPVLSRTYVWGVDLSGSLAGAGGVGGLLAISRDGVIESPMFDGNGNVIGLVSSADGSVTAEYEYDPFGNRVTSTGASADENPFRFSTKYEDVETGLLYYGFRYYDAGTGRWLNRDPIEEEGGQNLYAFVGNSGVNAYDALGEAAEWHHLLPQKWAAEFASLGFDIHDPKYGLVLDAVDHRTGETSLHRSGWNNEWDEFFSKNKSPSKRQVIAKLKSMYRSKHYAQAIKSGVKARMAYGTWKAATTAEREALHKLTARGLRGKVFKKAVPGLSLVFIVQDIQAKGIAGGTLNTLFDSVPYMNWVKLGSECVAGDWIPDKDAPESFEFPLIITGFYPIFN